MRLSVVAVYDPPRLSHCAMVGGNWPHLQKNCWFLYLAFMAVLLAPTSMASAANTTLLEAAESGDRAAALRLLGQGANPNAMSADGATAIMYAAANDDLDLVRALIKAGANVHFNN